MAQNTLCISNYYCFFGGSPSGLLPLGPPNQTSRTAFAVNELASVNSMLM